MPKQAKEKRALGGKPSDLLCPECGHAGVRTVSLEHSITYGVGEAAAHLKAVVPFRRCSNCHLQFIDYIGERVMHEAVCRHLGVMTPSEIKKLRQRHGLSRQEFASLTKLGQATIARWERGSLIQNAANDQLLYLLTFKENIKKLRSRAKQQTPPSDGLGQSHGHDPGDTAYGYGLGQSHDHDPGDTAYG